MGDNLHYEKFADGSVKCIEDEVPFDIPNGWIWCRLSQIITLFSGQDLDPSRYNNEGIGIPYITGASNLEDGKVVINRWTDSPTTHATNGDLLITCKGSGVGKMAWCDICDAHIARQIMALRCDDGLLSGYLEIVISAMLSNIRLKANGLIPGLSREIILEMMFPLPSLEEQKRICNKNREILSYIDGVNSQKSELVGSVGILKSKILDLAIRGQLVPQNPDDEPASVLLERIRAEKEELIKQGKLKRDKKESVIFRGEDNSYYEKVGSDVICIDAEIPFEIPDTWEWMRLESCCIKEIRRGKSPTYIDESGTLVFAQKCNTKYSGIDVGLALFLDESILGRYPNDEYMQDGDVVINSTGTGTLGRVGIYHTTDNHRGLPIVPDSHVTVIRAAHSIQSIYVYAFMKANQSKLEKEGEGSTNQKELKPLTLKEMLIPMPPYSEQERIAAAITAAFSTISAMEKSLK